MCCLAEPCPAGALFSLELSGPCHALQWHAGERRYRCGLIGEGRGLVSRLARRLIAAGAGCDSDAVVELPPG